MTSTLDDLVLDKGSHKSAADGMCIMEAVAYFQGQPFTDAPPCVSPILRNFGISLNGSTRRAAIWRWTG